MIAGVAVAGACVPAVAWGARAPTAPGSATPLTVDEARELASHDTGRTAFTSEGGVVVRLRLAGTLPTATGQAATDALCERLTVRLAQLRASVEAVDLPHSVWFAARASESRGGGMDLSGVLILEFSDRADSTQVVSCTNCGGSTLVEAAADQLEHDIRAHLAETPRVVAPAAARPPAPAVPARPAAAERYELSTRLAIAGVATFLAATALAVGGGVILGVGAPQGRPGGISLAAVGSAGVVAGLSCLGADAIRFRKRRRAHLAGAPVVLPTQVGGQLGVRR